MKRLLVLTLASLASVGVAATLGSAATAKAPKTAKIVIRHQLRGCHSWAVNGGAYKPTQSLTLARGSSITVVDNDVMPHTLVKTAGAAVKFVGAARMGKIGASTKVVFSKAGTYRFTTKVGEDYMKGVKTIGEDNVLRLTVKVA
jgi:plastocyanin